MLNNVSQTFLCQTTRGWPPLNPKHFFCCHTHFLSGNRMDSAWTLNLMQKLAVSSELWVVCSGQLWRVWPLLPCLVFAFAWPFVFDHISDFWYSDHALFCDYTELQYLIMCGIGHLPRFVDLAEVCGLSRSFAWNSCPASPANFLNYGKNHPSL